MRKRLDYLPLLRRSSLLPGESLPSLIERLARLNYYKNSGIIAGICHSYNGNQGKLDSIARPQYTKTFLQLANLSMIDAEQLFAASSHRFASILNPPGLEKVHMQWPDGGLKQMISRTAQRWIHSFYTAKFCSLCLKEAAYHRISWIPIASSICLKHKCLLTNRCPICFMNISVSEIVNRQCKLCKTDLRQAVSVSVADDEFGIFSQQVIQFWLSVAPASPSNSYTLPNRSAAMYHIWERLALCLFFCQVDWPNLPAPLSGLHRQVKETLIPWKKIEPDYGYYLHRKAFEGMLNWPQGFFRFLDAYSQRNQRSHRALNITIRFGGLGHWFRRIWQTQEFEFLKQILMEYLLSRNIPIPRYNN